MFAVLLHSYTKDKCCPRCDGKHDVSDCKATETRRGNCGGDHPSVAQKCPARQAELERRATKGGSVKTKLGTPRTYASAATGSSLAPLKQQVIKECLHELRSKTDAGSEVPENQPKPAATAETHSVTEQCLCCQGRIDKV